MSLDENTLITLAQLKIYLKETTADYDTILEMLINAASTLMIKEIREDIVYTTYTSQKVSGNGRSLLYVPNRPIVILTTVIESDATLTEDTDFYCHYAAGYLEKANGATWAKGIKNIELTYKAGYWVDTDPEDGTLPMPKDIQQGCMMQVGWWWKQSDKEDWGEVSRNFPDGSSATLFSIVKEDLLPAVKQICAKYRRRLP